MNADQAQQQLQENEKDVMLTQAYDIACALGYPEGYDKFKYVFWGIIINALKRKLK